jgi:hypothetical protein
VRHSLVPAPRLSAVRREKVLEQGSPAWRSPACEPHPNLCGWRRPRARFPRPSPARSHRTLRGAAPGREPVTPRFGQRRAEGSPPELPPAALPGPTGPQGWLRRRSRGQPRRELQRRLALGPLGWSRWPLRAGLAGWVGPAPPAWLLLRWPPPDGSPPAWCVAPDAPRGRRVGSVARARPPRRSRAAPARRLAPGHGRPIRAGASARAPARRATARGSRSPPMRRTPRSRRSG